MNVPPMESRISIPMNSDKSWNSATSHTLRCSQILPKTLIGASRWTGL